MLPRRGAGASDLSGLLKWFIFTVGHPRQMLLFLRIAMNKIDNPLRATYHSMAPYLFGDDKVVRYIVNPAGVATSLLRRSQTADFLTVRRRRARSVGHPGDKVVFDFSVQVRGAAGAADVENAMRWWKRRFDEIVRSTDRNPSTKLSDERQSSLRLREPHVQSME